MNCYYCCTDSKYVKYTNTLLKSLLATGTKLPIYVFTSDPSVINNIEPDYQVAVIEIETMSSLYSDQENAVTMRLSAADYLHDMAFDKAIYLDVDMVVNDNIDHLFDVVNADCGLAACANNPVNASGEFWEDQERYQREFARHMKYVNAGLLVLKLDSVPWMHLYKHVFRQSYGETLYMDQDYINWLVGDHVNARLLPSIYNCMPDNQSTNRQSPPAMRRLMAQAKVVHYVGPFKPDSNNIQFTQYIDSYLWGQWL